MAPRKPRQEPEDSEASEPEIPQLGLRIATVTLNPRGDIDFDFQGLTYWEMRGVLTAICHMMEAVEPHVHVHNMPYLGGAPDDDD